MMRKGCRALGHINRASKSIRLFATTKPWCEEDKYIRKLVSDWLENLITRAKKMTRTGGEIELGKGRLEYATGMMMKAASKRPLFYRF